MTVFLTVFLTASKDQMSLKNIYYIPGAKRDFYRVKNYAFIRLRLAGKMIIYVRLRLTKIFFFRGLIKYLAHNHPHITTILPVIEKKTVFEEEMQTMD